MAQNQSLKLRNRVFSALESLDPSNPIHRFCERLLLILISLNFVAVALETVAEIAEQYALFFQWFEIFSIAIFSVEYLLRLWSCTENPSQKYSQPFLGRLRYILSPMGLVDLLAILPFYLQMLINIDLRFMRLFRLVRILKLMRYMQTLETLIQILKKEKSALTAALLLMLIALCVVSSMVYFFEHETQPEAFASIPHAMWWGMATLTTVGYGDVVPETLLGRLFGILTMLIGIGMFALPTGILASSFMDALKRKQFIITWNMVASVPFFSQLSAQDIANISDLLKPYTALPNEIILHKDEPAQSMYFIITGMVEVEMREHPIRLHVGDFFGEIALLYSGRRTATVMALTYTELLQLDVSDFHSVLDSNPQLRQHLTDEARRRYSQISEEVTDPSDWSD